jgi:hypothetical protein
MGAWLGRRTEPRVDFRQAVRVIWPGEVSGVVARAVNLSSAGILVDAPTPTPCPVGSDVLCDVALPRGPRLLRGRVAHRRLLPSAQVGMGIEFVDLSPREAAELRDIVGESDEKPQRVKVRFAGTNQVVRARAFATEDGFRLATSLPFLRTDTEVDIALAPDANVSARGWVSSVVLERGQSDGVPRLLIDVRVDDSDPWLSRSRALTPVVEPLAATLAEAVPEHIWEPDDVGATVEPAPQDAHVALEGAVPTHATASSTLPMFLEAPGAAPLLEHADQTEIVQLEPRSTRWRALSGGMATGTIVLALFVLGVLIANKVASRPAAPAHVEPSVVVVAQPAPPAPVEPTLPVTVAHEPAVAPVAASADFKVGLTGSLAGAQRYPLRNPDGVAFNLPRAHATMKIGTYRPEVPGLKSVWVRALAGGGTHLRFFFSQSRPAPRVELGRGAVRVSAR